MGEREGMKKQIERDMQIQGNNKSRGEKDEWKKTDTFWGLL